MKAHHLLLTLLFLLGLSGVIHAETFDQTLEKAQRGDAEAQADLGYMYAAGEGVPKNNTEAVKWYRLAAEQGLAEAQYWLGGSYMTGHGVPRNNKEAIKWYRLAAGQGHADAQISLSLMYYGGTSVPENNLKAYIWGLLAHSQGNNEATQLVIDVSEHALTHEQIAEGQALATRCFESNYKDCD